MFPKKTLSFYDEATNPSNGWEAPDLPSDDFSDSLEDLIGSAPRTSTRIPPTYKPASFEETCPKCNGSGKFKGYSGRVVGDCFACKGQGKKVFKTSSEDRSKRRATSAGRKEDRRAAFAEDHQAEVAWTKEQAERQVGREKPWIFPSELLAKLDQYGSWTEGQLGAIRKFMIRDEQRAQERTERRAREEIRLDATALEQAFAKARERANRPGQEGVWMKPLTLRNGDKDDPKAVDVTFQPGSPGSRWEGMIFAKAGNKKLGFIKEGKFVPRFECSKEEKTAVKECCDDPAKAAIAYGKAWSVCSVCGATLTNDESIARGIGPICAERFGF